MKYFIWIISSVNIYLGIHYFLNVMHVLQNSKYSQTATAVFAILFLVMGVLGFYFVLGKADNRSAFLISVGPWVIGLLFLLFNMLTGDYK
ncbi:MAG: hypothetical protein WBP16_03300 [Ferruginibacter sp.]